MENWTQEYAQSLFDLDIESGWLIWKYNPDRPNNWNGRFVGKPAGSMSGNGYINVCVDGNKYGVHRIIWLWLYGYVPERIDHKDDNPSNNRPHNLRAATHSQNIFNGFCDTSTGVERHGAKYRARINVEKCRLELGSFDSFEEANTAYRVAALEHYGEFVR